MGSFHFTVGPHIGDALCDGVLRILDLELSAF